MKNNILIASGIFAVIVSVYVWRHLPRNIINRKTHELLHSLVMKEGSTLPYRQTGIYAYSGVLADKVKLDSADFDEESGEYPREEMESLYAMLCEQAKRSDFKIIKTHGIKVEGTEGEIDFTLQAEVVLPKRKIEGKYAAVFLWRRYDGGWRLYEARWRQVR